MRTDLLTKWGIAALGSGVGFVFGGWSEGMAILFMANILDFISGWIAGVKTTGLESKKSYIGIKRKVLIWVMVVVGHMIDRILGASTADIAAQLDFGLPVNLLSKGHMFRDAIVIAYLFNEWLSITENAGKAGLYIPPFIRKTIAVLKPPVNKGENNGEV